LAIAFLLSLAAFFDFLFFLKRLGRYLDCSYLADEAQWQIIAFLALLVTLIILPALALGLFIGLRQLGALLGYMLLLVTFPFLMIAATYLLVRYLRLLEAYCDELLRLRGGRGA
jgi:hypothetical protein